MALTCPPTNRFSVYARIREMGRNTCQPEQIIAKLEEAEALLSKGQTIPAVVRRPGISDDSAGYKTATLPDRGQRFTPGS